MFIVCFLLLLFFLNFVKKSLWTYQGTTVIYLRQWQNTLFWMYWVIHFRTGWLALHWCKIEHYVRITSPWMFVPMAYWHGMRPVFKSRWSLSRDSQNWLLDYLLTLQMNWVVPLTVLAFCAASCIHGSKLVRSKRQADISEFKLVSSLTKRNLRVCLIDGSQTYFEEEILTPEINYWQV